MWVSIFIDWLHQSITINGLLLIIIDCIDCNQSIGNHWLTTPGYKTPNGFVSRKGNCPTMYIIFLFYRIKSCESNFRDWERNRANSKTTTIVKSCRENKIIWKTYPKGWEIYKNNDKGNVFSSLTCKQLKAQVLDAYKRP